MIRWQHLRSCRSHMNLAMDAPHFHSVHAQDCGSSALHFAANCLARTFSPGRFKAILHITPHCSCSEYPSTNHRWILRFATLTDVCERSQGCGCSCEGCNVRFWNSGGLHHPVATSLMHSANSTCAPAKPDQSYSCMPSMYCTEFYRR